MGRMGYLHQLSGYISHFDPSKTLAGAGIPQHLPERDEI
jgi:hypothetical protein